MARAQDDPAYRETIRKRSEGIVATLKLEDPAVAQQVQAILEWFYPEVSRWHDTNGQTVRSLEREIGAANAANDSAKAEELKAKLEALQATRFQIGKDLEAKLSPILSADQITAIKDAMTFNRFHQMTAIFGQLDLTEEQAAQVREILELAREEAITAGSSEAKHNVFRRYIGRINSRVITQQQRDKLAELQGKRPAAN